MGVFAALIAALGWAIATRIYRFMGSLWSPLALTCIKSGVASVMFALWIHFAGGSFSTDSLAPVLWLVLSGAIGIGLGDTALFRALMQMGESRSLMIAETLAPAFVVIAAWFFLNEQLSLRQILGMVVVVAAVDMVVGLRRSSGGNALNRIGIGWATLSALCQAIGVIISRATFNSTDISAETSALWRLIGGLGIVVVLMAVSRVSLIPKSKPSGRQYGLLLCAIVLGTFVALWGLQLAIKLLPAGIAQTLLVTCALMAAMIAALKGERLRPVQWFGLLLGLPGVALVVM
ncbi:DMT family transporter [Porticoccus sp. W117]|uniref:DMT family transporter n=1 Tax=Porticoccus sp. W117 TaxID=3054777 RepID=UPI0025945FCB|nr:DMT family transporter [Porticoccus sp. W117]MDM3870756.1 DMT family transporter [Porticoccus sp. W117]